MFFVTTILQRVIMNYAYQPPDDFGPQGNALTEEGFFHIIINAVKEGLSPTNRTMDGFTCECEVLAGDNSGATFTLVMTNPQQSHNDGGLMCRKKIGRLLIATNLVDPNKPAPGTVDLQQMVGQSLVIEMRHQVDRRTNEQSRYPSLAYDNIFHVDDPRVAKVAKDAAMLAEIPPQYRHSEQWFAPLVARRGKQQAAKAPQQAAIDPQAFDL